MAAEVVALLVIAVVFLGIGRDGVPHAERGGCQQDKIGVMMLAMKPPIIV